MYRSRGDRESRVCLRPDPGGHRGGRAERGRGSLRQLGQRRGGLFLVKPEYEGEQRHVGPSLHDVPNGRKLDRDGRKLTGAVAEVAVQSRAAVSARRSR